MYDDASKWVLRRPPLHGLTPSAHDMAREYRVVAALEDGPVPVARAVTMRDDDSVLGAPFQMVEYVPGRVVRLADELDTLGGPAVISGCVDALIKVLADLHAVDPDAVGLGDFGRPDGYLEVTGRVKDVIIMAGRNIYPTDIERAASRVAGVRPGCAVAVRLDAGHSRETFAVAVESNDWKDPAEVRRIEHQVAHEVVAEVDMRPRNVVVLGPGTIPKTPSGKLRRANSVALVT